MGWIKRNLFFAIGGVFALLLLGAAGYYNYQTWSHDSAAFGRLDEIYGKLQELYNQKLLPGNAKVDNIAAAKEQAQEVRDWINRTGDFFKPIVPIPDSTNVTSEMFAADLRRTLDRLQHAAETASVVLPPKYGFSFEAQRSIVKFAPGSLPLLAVQLGEVKTISEIFFAARVNSLDSIQRCRVSDDDVAGPQADYLSDVSITNELAVLTPYVVTFRGFSSELASVLAGFATSPHGFIVKSINVQPAGSAQPTEAGPPGAPPTINDTRKGAMPIVLNHQVLRITLQVVIVKPLPRK